MANILAQTQQALRLLELIPHLTIEPFHHDDSYVSYYVASCRVTSVANDAGPYGNSTRRRHVLRLGRLRDVHRTRRRLRLRHGRLPRTRRRRLRLPLVDSPRAWASRSRMVLV